MEPALYESVYASIDDDCYAIPDVHQYADPSEHGYASARFADHGYEYSEGSGRSGHYDMGSSDANGYYQAADPGVSRAMKRATYFDDHEYDRGLPNPEEDEYHIANNPDDPYYARRGRSEHTYEAKHAVAERAKSQMFSSDTNDPADSHYDPGYDRADDAGTYTDASFPEVVEDAVYDAADDIYGQERPQQRAKLFQGEEHAYSLGSRVADTYSQVQRKPQNEYDMGSA